MAEIAVELSTKNAPCVMSVSGELDSVSSTAVVDAGCKVLVHKGSMFTNVIVDVAGVTFIDSAGLRALIAIRNDAVAANKSVMVRGIHNGMGSLFEITGLTQAFGIAPDRDDTDRSLEPS